PPYAFTLNAPNNAVGPKKLEAFGVTSSGSGLASAPVTIDVESPMAITSLWGNLDGLVFKFPGQKTDLVLYGLFSDGITRDVTASSNTSYETDNSAVVSVDSSGAVSAVGSGTAHIVVRYGNQILTIEARVPSSISGDLTGDGSIDQDDLNELIASLNQ